MTDTKPLAILDPIEFDYHTIIDSSVANGLKYMDLNVIGEDRKYFTKCIAEVDFERLCTIIGGLHEQVIKIVRHISTKKEALEAILNTEIAEVILKRPGNISLLQRYDVIVDENDQPRIVEVNSETPAGTPETINTYLFDDYAPHGLANVNNAFEASIIHNFSMIEKSGNIVVAFFDETDVQFDKVGEDVTNAVYLSGMIQQHHDSWIVNTEDIEMQEDGLYAYGKKIDNIQTFYPTEWYFLDEGAAEFWKLYLEEKFDIINGPINLISQSKAFWSYVFENMDQLVSEGVVTDRGLFDKYVPRYYFQPRHGTIPKARLFREGVGIGEETDDCVYQEYVEQKPYDCETYEGKRTGYLTLGVYCDDEKPIGMYTRFCEKKVTDYTSYFLPTYYRF